MTTHPQGLRHPHHAGVYAGTPEERIAALEGMVKTLVEEIKYLREDVRDLSQCVGHEAREAISHSELYRPSGLFR